MSPTNAPTRPQTSDLAHEQRAIQRIVSNHREWFMTIDGRSPLHIRTDEFDFSVQHGRLIFYCWTEPGSRTWRIKRWNWSGDKLQLHATRRMGSEAAAIELIPQASAKAIVANIAAARQERCERLAQLVAAALASEVGGVGDRVCGVGKPTADERGVVLQIENRDRRMNSGNRDLPECDTSAKKFEIASGLHPAPHTLPPNVRSNPLNPSLKIECAALSPGIRRDQPGRYARIVVRLPYERIAVTGTVAQSDVRNVDALFSSTLLWFQRLLQSPKRPSIQRLLLVVEHEILEAARQRHVLLRHSLRERLGLLEIDDEWTHVTPVPRFERSQLWRKRLIRFPPANECELTERAHEVVAYAPRAIDVVTSRSEERRVGKECRSRWSPY